MNFNELLQFCQDQSITFSLGENGLKVDARKGVLTAELGAELRRFKPELMAWITAHGQAGAPSAPAAPGPIALAERSAPLAASSGQQQLWLTHKLDKVGHAYHFIRVLELEGDLDVGALASSFSAISARHESLRTVFAEHEGELRQHILPPQPLALGLTDMAGSDRQAAALEAALAAAPFDLARDAALRLHLLRMDQRHHRLLIVLHHIASDGWSLGLLVRELQAAYSQAARGETPSLPPLPLQFADYAAWQQGPEQRAARDASLGFWKQALAGAPTVHTLPTDRARPQQRSFRGARLYAQIDAGTTAGLKALAQRAGTTLFNVLETVFALLVARYSRSDDVVLGTPVANRPQESLWGLIGYFANMVALRHQIDGGASFLAVLEQARGNLLDAFAHQHVPFEDVVRAVATTRSPSFAPLVQLAFTLQNNDIPELALPGLRCTIDAPEQSVALFDLHLEVAEADGGLRLGWEFATDLFDADGIARLSGAYLQLARSVLADPAQPVAQLPVLDARERALLVNDWNHTAASYPADKCLHQLFEEHAARNGDAIAILFEDQQISYAQVNREANQLAHYLVSARAITPDTLVGLCMDRSPRMFIAMLAVMKAGGAYIPLDPAVPRERLAYMLEDAALATVLTERRLLALAPIGAAAVCLDDAALQVQLAAQPVADIDPAALGLTPDCLAYGIYTSGSTGKPKCSLLRHAGLCNLTEVQRSLDVTPQSRVLQFASFAFDAATFEMTMALANGGALVLISADTGKSPEALSAAVERYQVTHATLPPVLLALLVREQWASVHTLIVAGDACSVPMAELWSRERKFYNGYGPSETTVCATIGRYRSGQPHLHIGRPIQNSQAYVVDDSGELAAPGAPGELWIGGVHLSRGYLGRPELTAEKFVADRFSDKAGGRLYRTGDLVRWLPDGNLEFLGRIDQQVKVRGFRIELGEIEKALLAHEQVRDAAVLACDAPGGDKRLVAWLVSDAASAAALADSVRAHLAAILPDYMVPAAFVQLDALPMTSNRKLDRKALPAPDFSSTQGDYIAPRTAAQQILCGLWQDVLGVARVGLGDNFFALGGHSLLATRLAAKINQAFNVTLPLNVLFNAQTLEQLSDALQALGLGGAMPAIAAAARDGALLPSYAQERMWMLDRIDGGSAHYNMPGTLRLSGRLDHAALEQAFGSIIARHESLRTGLHSAADGQLLQVVHPAPVFSLPLTDLSALEPALREQRCAALVAHDAAAPFDLAAGPMLRASVLKLGADEHLLLVAMHHIAADGWSMAVLVRELSAFYQAAVAGASADLPALAVQYADYAQWQRNWLQGEVLERQLAYWEKALAGLPVVHSLALDRARPRRSRHAGATWHSALDADSAARLQALCTAGGATLFMGLHAAFSVLLARHSNETDIVVGSPIANREQAEVAGLIGFFVNTLVLRSDLSGDPSFAGLLAQSRATLLGAYAHQQVPFEQIVARLRPERSLNHGALFQVMLVLQNNEQASLDLPGLTLGPVQQSGAIARYDLTLTVTESAAGLALEWEYDRDLFEQASIAAMAQRFACLLASLCAAPQDSVFAVPMLDQAEAARLVRDLNATATPFPDQACMHALIERQCADAPDAVAVVFDGVATSYAQLNARANQLAHSLIKDRGVGPDTLVGVCLERSTEMVVAILAVLKAGGAYVPLDPDYPAARLAYMLDDAALGTVITSARLAQRCALGGAALCLDDDQVQVRLALQGDSNPQVAGLDAGKLAYVIYTSGSTGNPKGVMVEHRALVNRIDWMQRQYGCAAADAILQKTPFSFDVSVWEFMWPLMAGARIVMAAPGGHKDPVYLSRLIEQEQVSKLHFVPSMLAGMLEFGDLARCQSLRQVFCSGEALAVAHVEQFRARCGWAQLHNLYGPTEAAIDVSFWDCAQLTGAHASVPIGRPIQNIALLVLGPHGQPVPLGVAGELHIGGVGLARGYLNRAELTAEKFIGHPLAHGTRLYRTGDLARVLANGDIEYLGRLDHQVKLRGLRVEPGEIEHALAGHPGVRQALVIAAGDAGNMRLVAYVVPHDEADLHKAGTERALLCAELGAHIGASLPEYMIPAAWVLLAALPLGPNGKVDRKALPAAHMPGQDGVRPVAPRNEVQARLCAIWQELLDIDQVGVHDNFFERGGNSLLAIKAQARINAAFNCDIAVADLFSHPTIGALAAFLSPGEGDDAAPASVRPAAAANAPIAIVGMSGRFSGARDIVSFWDNLCAGVESLQQFSDEELLDAGVAPAMLERADYVKSGVLLDERDMFDAAYFGFSPREAQITCPQQRLLLETAVEALEDSGYGVRPAGHTVGVFVSASNSAYLFNHLLPNPELAASIGLTPLMIAADKDFIATRIAYKLNLTGPTLSVNSACSSALVATAQACLNLNAGQCDSALVGAASIQQLTAQGYLYQEGGIASPDGHCRPFDQAARGTRGGSGVAMVMLKRLDRALADGDTVHAVIRGVGVNNDGNVKVGYTAPGVQGQAAAIGGALAAAGVAADSIGYIETHGTGTSLGDPIEVAALGKVFGARGAKRCALGAVKANIGHLDAAAGMAGLIKTVQVLKHKLIPPAINFKNANARINFEASPFYVNTALTEWASEGVRRAGVSSFGIGGTNAHLVLEEAPAAAPSRSHRRSRLLPLSAKNGVSLERAAWRLGAHLAATDSVDLIDVEYTLQVGREAHALRSFMVCSGAEEAISALAPDDGQPLPQVDSAARPVVFLFPGQGSQYVGMARGVYQQEPLFRATVDQCAALLEPQLGLDLRTLLYPAAGQEGEAAAKLAQTAHAQCALFVVEYALARLWMSWGVTPAAMIGHSVGEYVAACLSGVFSLEDGLTLIAARGRLMQRAPAGAMLSVQAPRAELQSLLRQSGCDLAAVNGPANCVAAGGEAQIGRLRAALEERGVACTLLRTAHAFHSAMMDEIVDEFRAVLEGVAFGVPAIPCVSNLDGKAVGTADAGYWLRHLRQTVEFSAGVDQLLAGGDSVFLEVGPGVTLGSLVRKHAGAQASVVVSSMRHQHDDSDDEAFLLTALGRVWQSGVPVDWAAFQRENSCHRISLPAYAFERQSYWIDAPAARTPMRASGSTGAATLYAGRSLKHEYVGPRDATEEQLVATWQELLGSEQIGIHDSFFDIGGDSLQATRLITLIGQRFGTALTLKAIFDNPRIADLAAAINAGRQQHVPIDATDLEVGEI